MLDAYMVRKAVPRIVVAVIGINLSIYLCVAAIDITNVIATGMAQILVTPFSVSGMTVFEVPTDPANGIAAGVGTAIAAGPLYSAIAGLAGAVATGGAGAALGSLLFLVLPIALLALAIVMTVVIRQAILFFLTVISPVAFACYVLPGTEKYFKQWWDIFLKTLLVYPIIAVIFALSDVFASIIMSTNSGGLTGIAKIVTGIAVIYAPLFLIPFAFRFAGGIMGKLAGVAGGLAAKAGQSGFIKARQEYYGQKHKDNVTRAQAERYRLNKEIAQQNPNSLRGRSAAWRARKIAGYRADIYDREAAINKRTAEAQGEVTNFGDDSLQRAYTVNKEQADRDRAAGRGQGDTWRMGANGLEYRSAGGSWQTENDVNEARRKFGKRNISQLQQSLAYEMKKAATQEEQDRLVDSFGSLADEWGMSGNEANGAWIGAGFANQDHNLQWKHGRWDNSNGTFSMNANGQGVIKEIDEKKGSYEASRFNADTWTTMSREVSQAHEVLGDNGSTQTQRDAALETIQRAARISSSLKGGAGAAYRDEDGNPVGPPQQRMPQPQAGQQFNVGQAAQQVAQAAGGGQRQAAAPQAAPQATFDEYAYVGGGASGRAAEEMRAFAKIADEAAAAHGLPLQGYGTSTRRSDTGQVTPRVDDSAGNEFQSNDDRNRRRET